MQQGIPNHVLEIGHCRYYPESGLPYGGIVSLLRVFNGWRILGGLKTLFMPVMEGNWFGWVPNVNVDWYCQDTNEVFEYLGCFWHGCLCMPNRHKRTGNTEGTLQNRYEETMARLQKIKDAGYIVVSIRGCEFRKLLRDTPILENELCSHPYVKNSSINIHDALYGGRTEATKTLQRQEWGRNPICGCYQSVPLHL